LLLLLVIYISSSSIVLVAVISCIAHWQVAPIEMQMSRVWLVSIYRSVMVSYTEKLSIKLQSLKQSVNYSYCKRKSNKIAGFLPRHWLYEWFSWVEQPNNTL